jgi:hypothetical protein
VKKFYPVAEDEVDAGAGMIFVPVRGHVFSADGTWAFARNSDSVICRYTVSTPGDITTATYAGTLEEHMIG